jgi:hypothetical protein
MKPFLEGHEDPVTVLLAREMEAISDSDIADWASRHTASSSYSQDPDYIQLVRFNRHNPGNAGKLQQHLTSLVLRIFPEFGYKSRITHDIARMLFLRRIRNYLDGDLDPMQICRMVAPIENRYDFPPWLGDLYNACDWMDERTTRDKAAHLRIAIEEILAENAERQSVGGK